MEMAGKVAEEELARHVYAALQSAPCPLVDGVDLQEAESMLQLLCVPSHHRTDILEWIYNSINAPFCSSKATAVRPNDQDIFYKDMAMLGQELMLCKADDLDLINGNASFHRQLQFLQQLLSVVPACNKSCGARADAELLLNELFSAENQHLLSQMLQPSLEPWPSHMKTLQKGSKSSSKPSSEDAADVATLLQQTRSELEQLQSECEFLTDEAQSPDVSSSSSSLQVAACDLKQLMVTFKHVYETELKVYCNREPPSFSSETEVFQRVHHLLLALNTELEILKEVTDASASTTDGDNQPQTRSHFQPWGQKHTFRFAQF
ncbi:HAUS augmin-like complex subunit 7 isoform X2 [Nelusetta ayraudi]|uniref:HAUS augmin-like complex subunit 7 isoform X2 n=1 Tax=Nelusetta ayraudi TaxID=303726 RepID=UPI003F71A432